MADLLLRQFEVNKLARILGVEPDALKPILASDPDTIRTFRFIVTNRLFSLHAERVAALAGLSKKVPAAISAKIAEVAFGPILSARVAGALDPEDAAKMSALLSPDFLVAVSRNLDPARVAPIIKLLPKDVIVSVGRVHLEHDDLITLARFVASVDPETAAAVIEPADGRQLLELALYVDDRSAMDPIVARFDDERLAATAAATHGLLGAAEEDVADAVVSLVRALGPDTRARWKAFAGHASPAVASALASL